MDNTTIELLSKHLDRYVLFEYSLKNLSNIKKQTFSHALFGTGGRTSFLKRFDGIKLGRMSILVPSNFLSEMKEFFETWKIDYRTKKVWLEKQNGK